MANESGRRLRIRVLLCGSAALCLALMAGCRVAPSNDRDWAPELSQLATAEFQGDQITVHNVRNCTYRTTQDYDVHYEDRTYNLRDLDSVDFLLSPFSDMPRIAHTFVSFGFQGRDYVGISAEVRRLRNQQYSAASNFLTENELIYVVGDERDLIQIRSNYQRDDVYLYHVKVTPQQAQALFVDMLKRANKLAKQPEFYNTLTNNCTTNIVAHVDHIAPGRIKYNYEVLLPGLSDKLAYQLGLIETHGDFAQTKAAARVNRVAFEYRDSPDFSQAIRR